MKRCWLFTFLFALSAVGCSVLSLDRDDPEKWLADFDTLKTALAGGYANLEWAADRNGIDLFEHARQTEAKLARTKSRGKARGIIEDFLAAFNDPHLRAEKSEPPPASSADGDDNATGITSATAAHDALDYMNYSDGKFKFNLDYAALDGWEALPGDDNPFPAGYVALPDGRLLGVIYIRYFGEDRYRSIAEPEWDAYAATIEGDCDGWCLWRFRYPVRARLMEKLQARIDELKRAGVELLAVDITRNGGGTEWADDVARFFSGRPLRCGRLAFIKHAHWERSLERNLRTIEADLERDDLSVRVRELLFEARDRIATMLDHVRAGCDRTALWSEPDAELTCSSLVEADNSSCGLFDMLDKSDLAELESSWILHSPLQSTLPRGAYTGPLIVVVDRHTASASEQFATLLQLNEAALIVGERTFGAGCGYTSGGISTYLPNVGLRVRMPDCVRYRADGENELAGIEPDIAPWDDGDNNKKRVYKLIEAIGRHR